MFEKMETIHKSEVCESDFKTFRSTENIGTECMTPENIRSDQDKDHVMKLMKHWKLEGR